MATTRRRNFPGGAALLLGLLLVAAGCEEAASEAPAGGDGGGAAGGDGGGAAGGAGGGAAGGAGGGAAGGAGGSAAGGQGGEAPGGQGGEAPFDPLALAPLVREQELDASIRALAAFGTRYTFAPGNAQARRYLAQRMAAYGYVVEEDPFTVQGTGASNLFARKAGTGEGRGVYIFSAHYDSTSETPETDAPGADDNASAVAAVLEAARLLAPIPLHHDVWFVFTGAEEQGSLGSAHMVSWLTAQQVPVRGVIAPDMIGYWPLGEGDRFDILGDEGSVALVDTMDGVAGALGVPTHTWINHDYCYGDDHTNFQEAGIPAISPMDCVEAHNVSHAHEGLPHYHQASDTPETIYLPLTTKVAGVIVATLALLASEP